MKMLKVYADWLGLPNRILVGELTVDVVRGKEVYRFSYENDWLQSPYRLEIDPELSLYKGDLFPRSGNDNFRAFLDSAPDRWGKLLMKRREAIDAKLEGRKERTLLESDYLLGVHDSYRMGGLRYKLDIDGPFLSDSDELSAPHVTSLRELEHAARVVEENKSIPSDEFLAEYRKWLNMLIAPGSSLGGARPKACVQDDEGFLIAKFPSKLDEYDVGAWEHVTGLMASDAGINMSEGHIAKFNSEYSTYLSRRFDRRLTGDVVSRIHFTSAMTQLGYYDGKADMGGGYFQSAAIGEHHPASYLELATFISSAGANIKSDLTELFRRIVFNVAVKNTDDHLRNHGFLFYGDGWQLSPAFDVNPNPDGTGLSLNISETSNALDLGLALQQAKFFRLSDDDALKVINDVMSVVVRFEEFATKSGIKGHDIKLMQRAFMTQDEAEEQLIDYGYEVKPDDFTQ
jgi:serine/threonine-protein kinase HipA